MTTMYCLRPKEVERCNGTKCPYEHRWDDEPQIIKEIEIHQRWNNEKRCFEDVDCKSIIPYCSCCDECECCSCRANSNLQINYNKLLEFIKIMSNDMHIFSVGEMMYLRQTAKKVLKEMGEL